MKQTLVDYRKRVIAQLKQFEKDSSLLKNKKYIINFHQHTIAEALSPARQTKYLDTLFFISKKLNKDFNECTTDDIYNFIINLNNSDYSIWTKHTIKCILKRFFKWLKGNDNTYPKEVSWIKSNVKRSEQILPHEGDLLKPEDINKLIEAANYPRDKAFIAMLYESGCRIGEIGTIKIRDIQSDQYGYIVNVTGKTGSRRIRLIFSTPYLQLWLQCHPYAGDKNCPLWINLGVRDNMQPSYNCFVHVLKKAFKKAGINKPSNPHYFRHSRATELANVLTEFQMNQYFGWIQGSDMPSTYVHLSGKEIDDTILAVNGLKNIERKESALKPKICSRCNTINVNGAERCSNCFAILDERKFMIEEQENKFLQEKRQFSDSVMDKLFEDPEVKALIIEKIKGLNILKNAI